jgi:hypothetical protein
MAGLSLPFLFLYRKNKNSTFQNPFQEIKPIFIIQNLKLLCILSLS